MDGLNILQTIAVVSSFLTCAVGGGMCLGASVSAATKSRRVAAMVGAGVFFGVFALTLALVS